MVRRPPPPSDWKDADCEGLSDGSQGAASDGTSGSATATGGSLRSFAKIPAENGSFLALLSGWGVPPRAANADPASLLPFARVGSLGFGLRI